MWLANISISVILDSEIVEQSKFTLISTIYLSGNLNNGHYTAHVKNNFSPAAVISCSKEVLENNNLIFYFIRQSKKFLFKVVLARSLASAALSLGVTTPPITPVQ